MPTISPTTSLSTISICSSTRSTGARSSCWRFVRVRNCLKVGFIFNIAIQLFFQGITPEEVEKFGNEMFKAFHMEMLVHGNVTKEVGNILFLKSSPTVIGSKCFIVIYICNILKHKWHYLSHAYIQSDKRNRLIIYLLYCFYPGFS